MQPAPIVRKFIPPPIQVDLEHEFKMLLDALVKHSGQVNLYHYNREQISVSIDGLRKIFKDDTAANYFIHLGKFIYQLQEGIPHRKFIARLTFQDKMLKFIRSSVEFRPIIGDIAEDIVAKLRTQIVLASFAATRQPVNNPLEGAKDTTFEYPF